MKKLAIAGASAVLAALPVVGTFAATTTIVDSITVGVAQSCQIGSDGSAAASITRTFSETNQQPGTLVTFTDSEQATQVAVKCNIAAGYTLTPSFTALAGPVNIAYDGSAEAQAGDGKWSASYVLNSGSSTLMTDGTAINGNSTMTDTYHFTYKVGLDEDQPTGTYTGTATYVLAGRS